MSGVLEAVLKMSCLGVLTACVLLPLKYVLQKCSMPRRILFLLWAIIGVRLICPIALQTQLSIFNMASLFENEEEVVEQQYDITLTEETILEADKPAVTENTEKVSFWVYIYFAGVFAVLLAGIADYVRLRHKLRFAVKKEGNVYTNEDIETAFVLGIVKPKIYIPEATGEEEYECIVAHERMHIARRDYIIKIVAYMIFAVHWFNPCVWLLFRLFSEDMELVCDECTILALGNEKREDYISSLLNYGKGKKLYFYSVGFSARSLKKRCICVKNVRKCSSAVSVITVIICVLLGFVMGTDAVKAVDSVLYEEATEKVVYEVATEEVTEASEKVTESVSVEAEDAREKVTESVIVETNEPETEKTEEKVDNTPTIKSGYVEGFTNIASKQMQYENMSIDVIKSVLENDGISYSSAGALDLSKAYRIKDFSYKENLVSSVENVKCDANSNISLYFELNTECFVWVTFFDAESGEQLTKSGILVNDSNVYSFIGCEKGKSYNIKVESPLGSAWEIEGRYIIY